MAFSHKEAVTIYICAAYVPKEPLCLSGDALPASMWPIWCKYMYVQLSFPACSCVMRCAQRASERRCARYRLLRRYTGDLLLQQRLPTLLQRADDHSLPARRHLEQP